MGKRQVIQSLVASGMTLLLSGFGFTGFAAADASISNTGPDSYNRITSHDSTNCTVSNYNDLSVMNSNSQTATTGDVVSADNTTAGWESQWASWNPATWQTNGYNFTSWWSGFNTWLGQSANPTTWHVNLANANNSGWTPASGNWQSSWSNWNPTLWEQNGQSFSAWQTQLMPYLTSQAAQWMANWPASATMTFLYGGATSGTATNNNQTSTNISVSNGNPCMIATPATGGRGGGSSISTTGPGSTNQITSGSSARNQVGNNNSFTAGNFNGQYASSGNMGSYANTYGGRGGSGNAANTNGTGTAGSVSNSGGSTSTPATPPVTPPAAPSATISNTGPDSYNTVSSKTSSNTTVTNTTDISVTNSNSQTATSGSAVSAGNTSTDGGGSGGAANANGTGTAFTASN